MSDRHDRPDVAGFARTLRAADAHPRLRGRWDSNRPAIVARAPGRLDVMGGIADYSGSLVLQMPIQEATLVSLQAIESRELTVVSLSERLSDEAAVFGIALDDLLFRDDPVTYEALRGRFLREPSRGWAAYVLGLFLVLMRERQIGFPHGARLVVQSDVPEGKGVASSAALEVAVMKAVDVAYGLGLESRDVALLCQKAENHVVGAPCGIMDQMTAVFGEAHRLLALLCQPAELQGTLAVPEGLRFWGVDSGIRHAVSGAEYGSVRVGAYMGYRILKEMTGKDWGGYLANLDPSELERELADRLPDAMTGADFLTRYGETGDPATQVVPSATYRVRRPTAHPVHEHFRLRVFARLIETGGASSAPLLGELMYQSHASYSACGLGSSGTDRLVALAREAGPAEGIFGAKITGGGSGGTVAVLGRRDAEATVRAIADRYSRETGYRPHIFSGSSPGAEAFGCVEL